MVTNAELLRGQWRSLRDWIETSGLLDHSGRQSVLEAWNIHELVTHIGRSFLELSVLGPAKGESPMTLRAYLSQYGSLSREIADGTAQLAMSFAGDVLGGIDNCARIGFRALDALRADVVRTPRGGAISRDDYVLTRLIELVVHGDDLARSAPQVEPPPLLDAALEAVSAGLADAYLEAGGEAPHVDEHLPWIRIATGRVPSDDALLPLL
ncbi:maleylpyruvate isomerase family mycothiol-dependent enzyme [Aeromicrobium panaciterrae]|uniref:maleylpyruvate isomerase N-terminal domain-containing protein n=1 Tax=Aeromicrobium panaciterrae TaxID=363861 RepID=UPI0031D2073F